MSDKHLLPGRSSFPEPKFDTGAVASLAHAKASRRQFIKGVIA
jgi:hypothetical protein